MNQCRNLDEFFDVLFLVEDTLITTNSLVLAHRCAYFKSMLSKSYDFSESRKHKGAYIKVQGVPKKYFSCIIQYIYSDHFYINNHNVEFFVKLLIYADYFGLPRLVEICSSYLKSFVNAKSALLIFLIAHAHNAEALEQFCINFIVMNEFEIINSHNFRQFKRQADDSLKASFFEKLNEEKKQSFIQACILSYMHKKNNSLIELYYGIDKIPSRRKSANESLEHSLSMTRSTSARRSAQANDQGLGDSFSSQNCMSSIMARGGSQKQKGDDEIEAKLSEILTNAPYIYLEAH